MFKTKEIKQQLGWDVTTGPAAFSGGSSEDTVPLTSQVKQLLHTYNNWENLHTLMIVSCSSN